MKKILIVEDNKDINQMLAEMLEFDMILLDIMLPYKSGDEVLKEIRKLSEVPVIIISAKDMIGMKIDLLKLGADDYITKQFDLGEVVARIESNLKRLHKKDKLNPLIEYKDIKMDVNKQVRVNEIELDLTAKEYLGDDNAVKTHMSNLRNKLKKGNSGMEYIETVWGLGYRLCK